MEELFVKRELAVLAKEKGFDGVCLANYCDGIDEFGKEVVNHLEMWSDEDLEVVNDSVPAPMYQQLVDWLWKKNIHINKTGNGYYTCFAMVEPEIKVLSFERGDNHYYVAYDKALMEVMGMVK